MSTPRARWWFCVAVTAFVAQSAVAQSRDDWRVCRQAPTRACVFAEALSRMRDDAPPVHDTKLADWDRLAYLRLSEIAAARKDRGLFDEARRSAESNPDSGARRSALRWVAAAQARSGFTQDATRTLEEGDDGGFATVEIALALARAGATKDALAAVRRLAAPEARFHAMVQLAGATREARYLVHAATIVHDIDDGYTASALRPRLAVVYAELGLIDDAQRVVRAIAVSYHRAEALAVIAAVTRNPGMLSQARAYATGFDGRGHEDEVWAALARAETALDLLGGARKTLETQLPRSPTRALAAATGALAAAHWLKGERPAAEALIDALLGGSWAIGEARAVLARRLIAAERFDDAQRVSFLADEITFDNLSAEIALKQAASGDVRAALTTADKIQHPARRSPTLAEIAAMMPE